MPVLVATPRETWLAAYHQRLRYLTPGTLTPIKVGAPSSENVGPSHVSRFDSVDGRLPNAISFALTHCFANLCAWHSPCFVELRNLGGSQKWPRSEFSKR